MPRKKKVDTPVTEPVVEKAVEAAAVPAEEAPKAAEPVKEAPTAEAPAKKRVGRPRKSDAAAAKAPAKEATIAKAKAAKKEEKKTVRRGVKASNLPEEKKAQIIKEKKAAKKAAKEIRTEVTLQWNGNDYTPDRLIQSAKDVWQYDLGKKVEDIETIALYVRPDEGKCYAVVNGEQLKFDI